MKELNFHLTTIFEYSGKFPIAILPPKVDCSCTEVIIPTEKIKFNTLHTITIKFDTKDKIGYQQREIILKFVSDAMDSRFIEKKLVFKGVVIATKETENTYKQKK